MYASSSADKIRKRKNSHYMYFEEVASLCIETKKIQNDFAI